MQRIGIVGLGFAGAALALFLRKKFDGEITIFERTPNPGAVGAGVLLQPSGQLVLNSLGLLNHVTAQSEPIHQIRGVTASGKTLITLPYSHMGSSEIAYGVHRGVLFSTLLNELNRHNIEIISGQEVREIKLQRENVRIKTDSQETEHTYAILTNGAWSTFRKQLGFEYWGRDYSYGALWAVGRSRYPQGELLQRMRGTSALAGLLPMGGGSCSFFWGIRSDLESRLRRSNFNSWREDALSVCPEAEELLSSIHSFEQLKFTRYRHALIRRQFTHNTLLLGDAAHPMSPHLGQGANMALVDAARFAQHFFNSKNFEQACSNFTRERRGQVRYYSILSLLLSPFFQSNDLFITEKLRDWILPIMSNTPWIKGQMALTMAGLKGGLFSGRLKKCSFEETSSQ